MLPFPGLESLESRESSHAEGAPIAMFHYIARPPIRHGWRGLYVTPRAFRSWICRLSESGFTSAAPSDFRDASSKRRICLTFDDGARDLVTAALPVLEEYRFTATAFIVAGRIGQVNDWDLPRGAARVLLADDSQIREWLQAGQRIGAHTVTHPYLTQLPAEQARWEISDSKRQLEDRFGIAVEDFCYPYGDFNDTVRDLVREAGFETACTVRPGTNHIAQDPFTLRRVAVQHRRPWLAAVVPGIFSPWC